MAVVYVIAADPNDSSYRYPFDEDLFSPRSVWIPDEDYTTIEVEEPGKDRNNPTPRKVTRKIPPLKVGVLAHRPVEWTVNRIIEIVTDHKVKINLLRICCHGDSGHLFLGNRPKGIGVEMLLPFAKLKPHFATGPGVRREIKIHACAVASDTSVDIDIEALREFMAGKCRLEDIPNYRPGTFKDPAQRSWIENLLNIRRPKKGLELLTAMAELTGASVQAAVNIQVADMRWRGPTIYVYPPPTSGFVQLDYDNSSHLGEFVTDPKTGQRVFRQFAVPLPPPPGPAFGEGPDIEREAIELLEKARKLDPQRGNVKKGNENTLKPRKKK